MADTPVQRAAEELADALAETCCQALKAAGFIPSERLVEKLVEEIRHAIALR